MAKPVTVTISHQLGREGASHRLRTGLDGVRDRVGRLKIAIAEERWEGDTLHFAVVALGQTVNGRITVEETLVRVETMLPWMLAIFAEKLKVGMEKQGQILLDKPRA